MNVPNQETVDAMMEAKYMKEHPNVSESYNTFSELYNDLLEAIEMEKGDVPLKEREGMPAKTLVVDKMENNK